MRPSFASWTAPHGSSRPSRATTPPTASFRAGPSTTRRISPAPSSSTSREQISDPDTRLKFMAPSAERFAEAMGALGIGDDSRVVLYSAGSIMWATRVWWMLRAFGFDHAAVLDGGWEKWQAEERPVSSTPGRYPPARFTARLKPGQFVDSDYVLSRLGDADTVAVNALAPEFHLGEGPEPLRSAGPDSGERQRACCDAARSVERGLRAAGRSKAAPRGRRDHPGPPRRRLLRRRHLRHRGPLPPPPTRLH